MWVTQGTLAFFTCRKMNTVLLSSGEGRSRSRVLCTERLGGASIAVEAALQQIREAQQRRLSRHLQVWRPERM